MRTLIIFSLCGWLAGPAAAAGKGPAEPAVGQKAPEFSAVTLDGRSVDLAKLKGKVLLINFFATWCPPCMAEMPRLEKEIWRRYRADKRFVLLAVGREHGAAELKKFLAEKHFTLPMAPDPKRGIYSKFAASGIPRNYLIDGGGRIVFKSLGYEEKDFASLKAALEKALPAPKADSAHAGN
ncbi:MAG: TlpA disulfide reductase family protein [Elusimicrobia bacterium]|nr:TlpA disulfide reductase family protein [Elusimicrobiota bacterium]